MKGRRENTKALVLSAIFSALSVLLLLLGSVIDVLDLTVAMLASMLVCAILIEVGKFWPWLTYAVTTVISLLLLPNKLPAVIFLLTGWYPIIKQLLERMRKWIAWSLKLLIFNMLLTSFLLISASFFPNADIFTLIEAIPREANIALTYALGNLVFVLYDIALSKLITYYVFVLRDRLKIGKK